jgi:hypothetical protein
MLALLVATTLAAPPTHPVTLAGGMMQAVSAASLGAGVHGRLSVALGSHVVVDVGLREGYLPGVQRTLGAVSAGVRYVPNIGPYVRAGFLHHHETPWALAKRFPVQTTLGSLAGISHRSGAELAIGADIPILQQGYGGRLGMNFEVSVGAFPDPVGSAVYIFVQQGFTIDSGRRRSAVGG